LYNTKGGKS